MGFQVIKGEKKKCKATWSGSGERSVDPRWLVERTVSAWSSGNAKFWWRVRHIWIYCDSDTRQTWGPQYQNSRVVALSIINIHLRVFTSVGRQSSIPRRLIHIRRHLLCLCANTSSPRGYSLRLNISKTPSTWHLQLVSFILRWVAPSF